jgi:hypothetical protein
MTLTDKFRALGYLWPGIDGAADLFETRDKSILREIVGRYFAELRAVYGREVISLTFAVFGNEATFEEAEAVKRNVTALRARAAETPNLLPLFSLGLRFDRVAENTGVFRTHAVRQGLTPAGWRWFTHQEPSTIRRIARFGLTPPTIAWLNLLAQAGEQLPAFLAQEGGLFHLTDMADQVVGTLNSPELFARAAKMIVDFLRVTLKGARDSRHGADRNHFLQQYEMLSVELVRTYRTNSRMKGLHGTWANLCERVERAYRDRERQIAEQLEAWRLVQEAERLEKEAEEAVKESWATQTWESAVPRSTIRGVEVVPLCSNDELVAEGMMLDHCLKDGTYLPLCISGKSRIFSLRGAFSSVRATLQISNYKERWLVSQLRTFANASAPAVFRSVAKAICDQYNQADGQ